MEVTILDSIIHGHLRPWKLDTTDTKKFSEWVRTADTLTPTTYQDLQKKISGLLHEFPLSLRRTANEKIQTRNRTLQKLFYKIELPTATNPFTQFYALLISNEAVRISNLLTENLQPLKNKIDIGYEVNLTLKSIRALAKQTVEELKERGFTSEPDAAADLTHFTLFYLKQILTILYFDIQHCYKNFVLAPETIETFSYNTLEATTPIRISPTETYFHFEVQQIISAKTFSKPETLSLLATIHQLSDASLDSLQCALENWMLIHDNSISKQNLQLQYLSDTNTSRTLYEQRKASLSGEIDKIIYGHQRLDLVNSSLDELHYINSTAALNLSAPSLLHRWLTQQKEVYTKNAHQEFAPTQSSQEQLTKGGNALPKKDKATVAEQKAFAQEQLKFMSGVNVHQNEIMSETDFKRMINYTFTLIETGKLPVDVKSIPKIGISAEHIRYTYYRIHSHLYGTGKINKTWIDFLHKVFQQFGRTQKKTTKIKFSVKPSSYDHDMKTMKK